MIAKKYRLTEREVKKVLQKGKPFFSYNIVSDILKNNYNHNRFAIVLSAKSVKSSVERNFFRRRFYDFVGSSLLLDKENGYDVVFVVKQKTKLDQKSEECLKDFYKDLDFLIKNIGKNF